MATTSNVLEKAKKLLAVRDGRGVTENEAAMAAEALQRLLQDHNLTLAQVEAAGGSSDEPTKREKATTAHRAMYAYQQTLMEALAENNFCLHVIRKEFVRDRGWGAAKRYDPETKETVTGHLEKRHVLVGRELNVAVTVQTYEYLVEALGRASPYDHRTTEGKRFLEGAATRVAERLREKRLERERESKAAEEARHAAANGSGKELVLSDVYGSESDLNNDALNGFPPGTTAARRRERIEKEAAQKAEHDRLVAEGLGDTEAWYRAYGYGANRAAELAADYDKWSRRRRGGRGRTTNWTQSDRAHHAKVSSAAYKAGRSAGDQVGLDAQVGATKRRAIEKK